MISQQAILKFSEAERPFGERLLKIAVEIDRIEGYSEPHAIMIARLAETLGAQMGLHGGDLIALKFAALVHDIGERVMKRNYLLRPGPLSLEETLDLWRHPILGEQAAGELRLSRQSQLLIRWHHEWWNGLGYPDGLSGEAIPVGARVLRVADSFCALVSNRPHRLRFDASEAEQMIADLAGIEFDPQVVRLLINFLAEERREGALGAFGDKRPIPPSNPTEAFTAELENRPPFIGARMDPPIDPSTGRETRPRPSIEGAEPPLPEPEMRNLIDDFNSTRGPGSGNSRPGGPDDSTPKTEN
ncbi:MAG TPA: HD domain-containing phosphohydrolase [Blastocatellia bacterium]|nr:HD domain-containing phosphohydrolase [Blastocatellia bacterium]